MIGALSTRQQLLLSKFLNSLNEEWDVAGIEHFLGQAREMAPGPELAQAAIRAAVTVGNRTPAVIAMSGPHWRPQSAPSLHIPADAERCSTCYEPKDRCRLIWGNDHEFVSTTENRRRAAAERARNRSGVLVSEDDVR